MADSITIKVIGLEEVMANLKALTPKIADKAMRVALDDTGIFFAEAVREVTPSGEGIDPRGMDGLLKSSIDHVVAMKPSQGSGRVTIGPRFGLQAYKNSRTSDTGIYSLFVEFGLKVRKYLSHPFMRPAFDANAEKAIDVFAESMKVQLEKLSK